MGQRKGAHGAGTWSFPGGAVEKGDPTVEAAAARELLEETGIEVKPEDLKFLTQNLYTNQDGKRTWLTIFYTVETPNAEPQNMEPDKCEGWEWVPAVHMPKPVFTPVEKLILEALGFR